jgi:hypothetical protein
MTMPPRITREWVAGQSDLMTAIWPLLRARLCPPVGPTSSSTNSARTTAVPEGLRWIWHAGNFLQGLEGLGVSGWFQQTLRDDPTGTAVEAAYIALNRLGLLSHARILALGAGLAMGWAGPAAEKVWRGLMGDAGLQAPPRARTGPPTEKQLAELAALDHQFRSLEQDWRKHIERFVKTNPRQFVEG